MAQVRFAPFLAGVRYVQMLRALIDECGKQGILVMVANHRLTPFSGPGKPDSGLWYSPAPRTRCPTPATPPTTRVHC